jgi:hypothetical protein
LRGGRFFASTGEVLIPEFTVSGQGSGGTLTLPAGGAAGKTLVIEASIEGTFPLAFAEVVSGDGAKVYRERMDLSASECFDRRPLRHTIDAARCRWVRLEVWDMARNGAFTQPVWIE